jgi:hypothetical protein
MNDWSNQMKKSNKPKAKVNDVLLHKEEERMFIVANVSNQPKGRLYTLKELGTGDNIDYKRYYENKLVEKCGKVKNAKAAKVLYGKKK